MVNMSEIEEIKKLDPEERIKRLKKIEQGRKKEIEEAEALIRDSMREIGDVTEKKHAPIKQVTAMDVSQLVTAEEKRMFKTARFSSDTLTSSDSKDSAPDETLEEVAEEEAQGREHQKGGGPIYGGANEGKVLYKGDMKTTGASTDEGPKLYKNPGEEHGTGEVYNSKSVTGASKGPGEFYNKNEGDISGTYERGKAENEKKKRIGEVY
jgi:hypothetical protein